CVCASRRSASPYFSEAKLSCRAVEERSDAPRIARTILLIRPRASGGGGPSCAARWWKGAGVNASLALPELRRGRAPSTILRSLRSLDGPPPPLARGRMKKRRRL